MTKRTSKAVSTSEVLAYHAQSPAGKLSVEPSKACRTQRDLSLAYTPGVAIPSLAIAQNPASAYRYTNKGNLVAVISNGTATLGLGDIGALASKPVMEGKCVLFKRFAGIDAFDIELDTKDPEEFVNIVERLGPTFGGINLEDIAAPECFEIEDALKKRMSIPVFHDDQHGTAIISGAALLNALEITGKKIDQVKVVVVGAGAAGIRCAEHYIRLGVRKTNLWLVDQNGVLHTGRKDLAPLQKKLARVATNTRMRTGVRTRTSIRTSTNARTLAQPDTLDEALLDADVLLGVSAADIVTPDMIRTMAANPIIFTLANPNPEIAYLLARRARPDAIIATGRSDYPNQINNILGFPFVFRGALDTQASTITEGMKLAATHALSELTHQPVPGNVRKAYQNVPITFGPDYIVPKPFDQRVLIEVSYAVAKAAQQDGVARAKLNLAKYRSQLTKMAKELQQKYS